MKKQSWADELKLMRLQKLKSARSHRRKVKEQKEVFLDNEIEMLRGVVKNLRMELAEFTAREKQNIKREK